MTSLLPSSIEMRVCYQAGSWDRISLRDGKGREKRSTLRDRCPWHVACQGFAQARQRAVEGGLHSRLRQVEHATDFREGQLPKTAQPHDRTQLRGQGNNGGQ